MERGEIAAPDIHDGSFEVRTPVSRNRLDLVLTRTAAVAVKHHRQPEAHARERSALEGLARAALPFRVPRVVSGDGATLTTATSSGLRALRPDRVPTAGTAARIGRAIAALHEAELPPDAMAGDLGVDPSEAGAWILDAPPGVRSVVLEFQRRGTAARIRTVMGELSQEPPVFGHGDIRTANLLLGASGLWLIDWETAGALPRRHDLGAAFAMILEIAVSGGRGQPHPEVLEQLIRGYEHRARREVERPALVAAAGLSVMRSALERASVDWPLGSRTRALMTLGTQLLHRPADAIGHLGLRP